MSFITAIERVEIETAFIHSVTIIWTQLRSNLDAYGDFCPRLAPYLDGSVVLVTESPQFFVVDRGEKDA